MPLPHFTVGGSSIEKVIYEVVDSTLAYLGKAPAGASQSDPVWQIMKIVSDSTGSIATTYSGGTILYNYAWVNRATLSYS
jgi:hypothetical protein